MDFDELEEDSQDSKRAGAPAWMATFGDLMSLLLTFFVLLLSFANMDIVKFRDLLGSIQQALGVETQRVGTFQVRSTTPVELSESESTPVPDILQLDTPSMPSLRPVRAPAADEEMLQDLRRVIAKQGLEDIVEAEAGPRGVTVRVKGQLLFEPGAAALRPESSVFLDEIAKLAKESGYMLSIEGHTDDVPIQTPQFPSNWHLSSWRAIAALRYLVDAGGVDPKRVSSVGYADTRPRVPNDSPEHRAMNRRVEFVFYRGAPEGAEASSPDSPAS